MEPISLDELVYELFDRARQSQSGRAAHNLLAGREHPLSQTVMLDINPPERQAKAMSVWGMGVMVGPILGPVLGGWLTESYDWRWVFYVNLPIGIGCFAILWALLPSRPVRRRPFDLFGNTRDRLVELASGHVGPAQHHPQVLVRHRDREQRLAQLMGEGRRLLGRSREG